MPASISAVGLRIRAHPRDPTTTVPRQVEGPEGIGFPLGHDAISDLFPAKNSLSIPLSRWIIDLATLIAMLGHSRIRMVLRYAHPARSHQANAMAQLERINGAQDCGLRERAAHNDSVGDRNKSEMQTIP